MSSHKPPTCSVPLPLTGTTAWKEKCCFAQHFPCEAVAAEQSSYQPFSFDFCSYFLSLPPSVCDLIFPFLWYGSFSLPIYTDLSSLPSQHCSSWLPRVTATIVALSVLLPQREERRKQENQLFNSDHVTCLSKTCSNIEQLPDIDI